MKINLRIKEEREQRKISQSYMALELGLDQSQYSRRENGAISFTVEELLKISEILNINPQQFFEAKALSNETLEDTNTPWEKLITRYELWIKEKDERIALLTLQLNKKS